MKNFIIGVIGLVAVTSLIISLGKVGGNSQPVPELGATGTRFPNGISADTTSPSVGQVRGTTLTSTGATTIGGTFTVTTSNTATSTTKIGCLQSTATSTLTPVKLVATTTQAGGVAALWVFGNCP